MKASTYLATSTATSVSSEHRQTSCGHSLIVCDVLNHYNSSFNDNETLDALPSETSTLHVEVTVKCSTNCKKKCVLCGVQ